jgi:hypothetical protein
VTSSRPQQITADDEDQDDTAAAEATMSTIYDVLSGSDGIISGICAFGMWVLPA